MTLIAILETSTYNILYKFQTQSIKSYIEYNRYYNILIYNVFNLHIIYFFPQITIVVEVLTSNRRWGRRIILADLNVTPEGAIAGCHCIGGGWRPILGEWTWCHCCVPLQGAIQGHLFCLHWQHKNCFLLSGVCAGIIFFLIESGSASCTLWLMAIVKQLGFLRRQIIFNCLLPMDSPLTMGRFLSFIPTWNDQPSGTIPKEYSAV